MYEIKMKELQTRRDELVKNHQILTAQLNDITVSIHQLDGALAVLQQIASEGQTSGSTPEVVLDSTTNNIATVN